MHKLNELSRCLTPPLQTDGTLIAVIEMGLSSWVVAGIVPGVERQPLKKLAVDEKALLKLLYRWRDEASKTGHRYTHHCRLIGDARDDVPQVRLGVEPVDSPAMVRHREGSW
jgi:hypothetical protein